MSATINFSEPFQKVAILCHPLFELVSWYTAWTIGILTEESFLNTVDAQTFDHENQKLIETESCCRTLNYCRVTFSNEFETFTYPSPCLG